MIRVEIVAIGDELTSGVRLDTNSQWLSQQVEELGLHVCFHSTVGDDLDCMTSVFTTARERADIVLCTGGLGPTADDLTRHAWAQVAEVGLEENAEVLAHIQSMFQSRGREMPANNKIQAMFPVGSRVIPNPEGTAPGIELVFDKKDPAQKGRTCRMFAFPGVPAEMKQMWDGTLAPRLRELFEINLTTYHHTLHCFGTGESAIETMLPDLIRRGRDPLVGITASAATISLRVSTRANSIDDCRAKMEPTLKSIYETLGDLVYGENGIQLEDVVVQQLASQGRKVHVLDAGMRGEVARRIAQADLQNRVLGESVVVPANAIGSLEEDLDKFAERIARELGQGDGADLDQAIYIAVGPINRDEATVQAGNSFFDLIIRCQPQRLEETIRFSGHSSWRENRAVKDVLNRLRLKTRAEV